MKGCELCSNPARLYCEADGASLCCNCDEKVHSANFLVAKHTRNLLCHVCQSQTPWKATGTKLGPTVSVCETCVDNCSAKQGRRGSERAGGREYDETDVDFEGEDEYTDDDEDEDEDEDEEFSESDEDENENEEEADNQVVPWLSSSPASPPTASSSCIEVVSSCRISSPGGRGVSPSKRTRVNAVLDSEDEIGCTSSLLNHKIESTAMSSEANTSGFFRSVKVRRLDEEIQSERIEDRNIEGASSMAMLVSEIRRLHQNTLSDDNDASAALIGIYRLSKDPTVV